MSSPESSARIFPSFRLSLFILLTIFPWLVGNCQTVISNDSLQTILTQARSLVQQKDLPAAIERYELYLRVRSSDDDVRNELAKTYSWNAQYDSAIAQYDLVLGDNRNNFDARYGKCQVLAWKHDYEGALTELESLMILSPMNLDVFLLGGKIYAWKEDFARSLEMYQKALSLDGLNVEAIAGKCRALDGLGENEEAFEEISDARTRFPDNAIFQQLYEQLAPRPKNQVYVGFQNENFDVTYRSDYRTWTAQYYRTLRKDLTVYAEFDEYRRFDQDDQSLGLGVYWGLGNGRSLYAYCLASPDPRVTSTVDFSAEVSQQISEPVSVFAGYRLLDFKTETAHIFSPGFSLDVGKVVVIRPRLYVSRTIMAKATSVAYAIQVTTERIERARPFFYYAIGNEAYRGVTLDNVESSQAWSLTVGSRYWITKVLVVTGAYQYLNRIGFFRSNAFTFGAAYYW